MPPAGINDILPPEKEQAIVALLREPTVTKAAETVGVDESTLYRWLRDPVFSGQYRNARREAFRHAIALTQKYAPAAVQTLMKVMADPAAAHTAKVSAAGLLLKFSRESIELDDLASRIEALEQVAGPQPAAGSFGEGVVMLTALSRRLARVESTAEVARRVPATRCSWEWTLRLAAFDQGYYDIAAVGIPIVEAKEWVLIRAESPRVDAGTLFNVLIEHSRMAYFVKDLSEWKPTDAEMKSADLFTALMTMGKAYVSATGDYSPFSLPWSDHEGWAKGRYKDARRQR